MRNKLLICAVALVAGLSWSSAKADLPKGVTQELFEIISNPEGNWKALSIDDCMAKPSCEDYVSTLVQKLSGEHGLVVPHDRTFDVLTTADTLTFTVKPEAGKRLCKALLAMNAMRPASGGKAPAISASASATGLDVAVKLQRPNDSYEAFVVLLSADEASHAERVAQGYCSLGAEPTQFSCQGGKACREQQF